MLAQLPEHRRAAITDDTDREHMLQLLRAMQDRQPARPSLDTLDAMIGMIARWCHEIDPSARLGLNLLLTDGRQMIGSCLGRPLHFVERRGVHDCYICGFPLIHHKPPHAYRAVLIASVSISHEELREVPDGSVYRINPDYRLELRSFALGDERSSG